MTATADRGYTLDPAWHAERDRLNSITSLYDPQTLQACSRLGLGEGWRCLDIGAGTGSVAELLAERVGENGRVLAVDIDVRFLEPLATDALEVLRADVRSDKLPDGFDLVHARLVLEHLPEREAVLDAMVSATRPGGWVLVEDFDWSTAAAVDPPSEVHAKVVGALKAFFSMHGYDAAPGPQAAAAAASRWARARGRRHRVDPGAGPPRARRAAVGAARGSARPRHDRRRAARRGRHRRVPRPLARRRHGELRAADGECLGPQALTSHACC